MTKKFLPRISSDFALLDVELGREPLASLLNDGLRPKIIIEARVVGQWSRDDGTSSEFELEVVKLEWEPE